MRNYKKNITYFCSLLINLISNRKLDFSEFCGACQQKFMIKQIKEVDRGGSEMIIIYFFN